eukprot:2322645-Pyramimonas_sp.AAC.1
MSVHLLHLQSHPYRIRLGLAVQARHDPERGTREAMCGRQDPIRGDERPSAKVSARGLERHLPRPLAT